MSKRKGGQLSIASWCKRPVFTNVIRTVDDDVALKLFNCTVIKIMTMFVVPTIDVFRFSKHTMANSKNKLDIVHYVHLR